MFLAIKLESVVLVDGDAPWLGRVELTFGGIPGTVCDYDFGKLDAQVVCRMANYRYNYITVTILYH